jgi:hypothetical protein
MWYGRLSTLVLLTAAFSAPPSAADDDGLAHSAEAGHTPAPEPTPGSARKRVFWAGGVEPAYAAALHVLLRNAPQQVVEQHVAAAAEAAIEQSTGAAPDEFVPARGYKGERYGYKFTHVTQGLGYYLQEGESERVRHAAALMQLSEPERTELELAIVRANAHDVRDREHAGDAHQHFSRLDVSNDGHLDEDELLSLLGGGGSTAVAPAAHPELGHAEGLQQVRGMMARSLRRSFDEDSDGRVHRSEFMRLMIHQDL